ncbi:hypothetical protein PSEUDO8AS_70215 [Pseudomonas sp. 8AS]|nr:hypothetical protein PSEUDO8AS_70215 [Pseudomonas sp. 8AS]
MPSPRRRAARRRAICPLCRREGRSQTSGLSATPTSKTTIHHVISVTLRESLCYEADRPYC